MQLELQMYNGFPSFVIRVLQAFSDVLIVLHFPFVSLMVRGVPLDESCLGWRHQVIPSAVHCTLFLGPDLGFDVQSVAVSLQDLSPVREHLPLPFDQELLVGMRWPSMAQLLAFLGIWGLIFGLHMFTLRCITHMPKASQSVHGLRLPLPAWNC